MPYQINSAFEARAALPEILSNFADHAQEGQTLGLTRTDSYPPKTTITGQDVTGPAEAKAALDFVKQTMDQQLGPGTADRLLGAVQLKNPDRIEVGELKAVGTQFAQEMDTLKQQLANPNNDVTQKWQAAATSGATPTPKGAQENMQQLLEDPAVKWSVATSGSGGALIAVKPDGTGAVVKIEGMDGVKKASALSDVLNHGFSGNEGAYEVASVTDESANLAAKQALGQKLEQMKVDNAANPAAMKHLNNHSVSVEDGHSGVSKMNFVSGTQLNKLPLQDKLALLQTGQLAKEIGKASVLCPVAGLADHASPDVTGLPTNMSNFLISEETGKISPIDFDTKELQNGNLGVNHAGAGVKNLMDLATQATQSKASFDQTVAILANDFKTGQTNTQLGGAVSALSPSGNCEGLFSDVERKAVTPMMTDELARQQAVSLLQGTIDGLEHLQQNEQAIRTGLEDAGMGDPEELEQGFKAVQGVDFAKMKQDMQKFSQGQEQSTKRSVREMMQAAKHTVARRIGIDTDSKLARAEKQLERRETHLGDLKERREGITQELAKKDLDWSTRADLVKAAGKIDGMITKNIAKVDSTKLEVEKQKLKVGRHEQGAKKGQAAGVSH